MDARMDADDELLRLVADLDPDQRGAVTTPNRLVAVIAGAGSGKTRVLTRRIAYRIASGDADARHTLALTFTREAAGELRRRLHRLGLREPVEAGTFHAVMLRVLRQRWTDTGRQPRTIVGDRRRLLRDTKNEFSLSTSWQVLERAHDEISWAMARGIAPDAYAAAARRAGRRPQGGVDDMAHVFDRYALLKRRRGIVDFDDVLTDVLGEATRDPEFADVLRWRFRHLLVDEAQDLNPIQHRIVDLLRQGRDDLFLVGDPAQAVYGFNGTDPTLLIDVETRFPGVEVVRLPVNHRCTPQIVDVGSHVLSAGGQPIDIRSARDDGAVGSLVVAHDETAEAAIVADRIVSGDITLVRAGNVAVLARTNAQLAAFETALSNVGVPVRRSAGATGTPLESAIRDAATSTSPTALRTWAHDTLDDLGALESATSRVDGLEHRRSDAARTAARVAAQSTDRPATTARRRPGSGGTIAPHAAQLRAAAAELELVESARRVATTVLDFLREQPRGDGAEFRAWIATTNPFADRSTDGVELLSFHAAKGREWHTVFVTGLESSLMPIKSATTQAEQAEEARLLYVAVTRATDVLVLTRSERRRGYAREPSPLLSGLDLTPAAPMPPPRTLHRRAVIDATLERLQIWRSTAAAKAHIVPTELLTDRDLALIVAARPRTAEELDAATGVGLLTARRLAPELLPLLG